MTTRLVILSDLHLGRPDGVQDAAQLEPLVEDGGHLVLNGDTVEQNDSRYRARAVDALGALLELAVARGTRLTLLAGNHDPAISADRALLVAGGSVLITHGDAFHPAVAPWSVRARAMRSAWDETLASFPPERRGTLEATFAAAKSAGEAERDAPGGSTTPGRLVFRPRAAATIVSFWWRFPALAAAFAERFAPTASIIIAGHSHRPGVRITGKGERRRTVVNTGSFARPHAPHAAIVADRTLSFVRIVPRSSSDRRTATFTLSKTPIATIALQAPVDAPSACGIPALSSLDASGRPSAASIPFPAASSALRSTRVASPDLSHA